MKVKVRIALAVDENGDWSACGWRSPTGTDYSEKAMMDTCLDGVAGDALRRYWVEAEVETPAATETIAATVQ